MTEPVAYPLDQWAYQGTPPACSGRIRTQSSDFRVSESLGFDLDEAGKHLWIYLQKTDQNTIDVCNGLSRAAGVHPREIGVSGQKDRNAVTAQWFSILAEKDPADTLEKVHSYCAQHDDLVLLDSRFHSGKLKRGSHRSNRFSLIVRELTGDLDTLEESLDRVSKQGVPNYFGPQRFGRNGKNMLTAVRLFNGENKRMDRQARSMALSSARSWIFNQVVSDRLRRKDIAEPQIGDAMMLDGTQSWFVHDGSDDNIVARWQSCDLHITAPMWGKGELATCDEIRSFEQGVVTDIAVLPTGLIKQGLAQQRRAVRIVPVDLQWTFPETGVLQLQFGLTRGGYATSILRELLHC